MEYLSIFLFNFALSMSYLLLYHRFSKKRRIYCNNEGWQPINTLQDDWRDVLLTDGERVYAAYFPNYNKKGQCIFSYENRVATHWRPHPNPPMNVKK